MQLHLRREETQKTLIGGMAGNVGRQGRRGGGLVSGGDPPGVMEPLTAAKVAFATLPGTVKTHYSRKA
jgi:hypothetical protein